MSSPQQHSNGTGWPFDAPEQLLLGLLDTNHTSTLSTEYIKGTLPTPWPFLLASTLLSQVLGIIGLYSVYKSREEVEYLAARAQPGRKVVSGTIITHVGIIISTIRSISALIASIKTRFHGTGSYAAPSSMLLLMASLHPYFCSYNSSVYLDLLVALDLMVVYIAFLIMAYGPLSSHLFYAKFIVTGGNCAFYTVHGCSTDIRNSWNLVGCGDNSPQGENTYSANNGDPNDHNIIHAAERVISWFGVVYGFYMIFCGAFVVVAFFDQLRNHHQGLRNVLKWGKGYHGTILGLRSGIVTFGFAVVIALVSIPIHATQEIKPKNYMYVDGFGTSAYFVPPHGGTFTGGNATLWSDCFSVVPPFSQNGFWSVWVAEHGGNVARLLALI